MTAKKISRMQGAKQSDQHVVVPGGALEGGVVVEPSFDQVTPSAVSESKRTAINKLIKDEVGEPELEGQASVGTDPAMIALDEQSFTASDSVMLLAQSNKAGSTLTTATDASGDRGSAVLQGGGSALPILGGAALLGLAAGGGGSGGGGDPPPPPPPPALEITSVIDNFPTPGQEFAVADGGLTNDRTPTLYGTGEVGAVVNISQNGSLIGTATIGNDGTWVFDVPELAAVANGVTASYQYEATYADGRDGYDQHTIVLTNYSLDSFGTVTQLTDDRSFYTSDSADSGVGSPSPGVDYGGDLIGGDLVDGDNTNGVLWTNDQTLEATVKFNFIDQSESDLSIDKVELLVYSGATLLDTLTVYSGAALTSDQTWTVGIDLSSSASVANELFDELTLVVKTYSKAGTGDELVTSSETFVPDFRLDDVDPNNPEINRAWTTDPGSATTGPVTVYVSGTIQDDAGSPVTRFITVLADTIGDVEIVPDKRYENTLTGSDWQVSFASKNIEATSIYNVEVSAVDEAGNTSEPDSVALVLGTNTGNDDGSGKVALNLGKLDAQSSLSIAGGAMVFAFDGNDLIDGRSQYSLSGDVFTEDGARDASDIIYGGKGADTVYAGDGDDWVFGGDNVDGSQDQKDLLMGGAGEDRLFGENQIDVLVGGDGSDYLSGGSGQDEIYLGAYTAPDTSNQGETSAATDYVLYAESSSDTSNLDQIFGFQIGGADGDKIGVSLGAITINSSVNSHTLSNAAGSDLSSVIDSSSGWDSLAVTSSGSIAGGTSNLLVLTESTATSFASAIGSAKVSVSGINEGSGASKTYEGVLTAWFDDALNQMVLGYVINDSGNTSTNSEITSADSFFTIARIDYTWSNATTFQSDVEDVLVTYNPSSLVPPSLIA